MNIHHARWCIHIARQMWALGYKQMAREKLHEASLSLGIDVLPF